MPLEVSFGQGQTTSTDIGQTFLQLVLPLGDHVYHRSELGPFLCDRKSIATYAILLNRDGILWQLNFFIFLEQNSECFNLIDRQTKPSK